MWKGRKTERENVEKSYEDFKPKHSPKFLTPLHCKRNVNQFNIGNYNLKPVYQVFINFALLNVNQCSITKTLTQFIKHFTPLYYLT